MKKILFIFVISNFSPFFSSDPVLKELQKINPLVDELVLEAHKQKKEHALNNEKQRTVRRNHARDDKAFRMGTFSTYGLEIAYLKGVSENK